MDFLLLIAGVFFIGYWLVKTIVLAIFNVKDDDALPTKHTTVINNYYSTTNNHLHVDKIERLKK